jgi:predicted transposase YbfD/YdcC
VLAVKKNQQELHEAIEDYFEAAQQAGYREDDSRLRSGYGAENFAVIRHIALNLLKREPSKASLKRKRYKAALSNEFRSNVLFPQ